MLRCVSTWLYEGMRMTISDQPGTVRQGVGLPIATDLDDADRLISDLAALVDAGLVSVRRQPHGPPRYEAVAEPPAAE